MQPDGGWIFAAGLAGRLRCYLSSVSGRCAAPPLSTRAHVCRLCMVHVPASLPIMFALPSPISSWRTSLHPIADAMVRVPPCVQLTLESVYALHSLNVGWFQAAAWDFDMLLRFARVESGRAEHTAAMGGAESSRWIGALLLAARYSTTRSGPPHSRADAPGYITAAWGRPLRQILN